MLAMMVAALSFTACGGSEEDDEVEGSSSFLIGTWSVSTNSGVDSGDYFQFKSDGTFTSVSLDYNDVEIKKGIWRIIEDELVLDWKDGGDSRFTIIIHTKSTMTVTFYDIPIFFTKVSDSKIKKYLK